MCTDGVDQEEQAGRENFYVLSSVSVEKGVILSVARLFVRLEMGVAT